ncbi:MAG: phosphorylase [Moorea sp. SIO1G6]|uniref:5'-methylthioadenosine/S-adenosylhomocysteine nucleosidase family protein n=1 Tax=Moorena sp. SIO1G6 TaxID=2607840 RepID=UPI0013C0A0FD|nr:phosphorylase [Moorena sp. SIO1G6]NET63746.1 phosphorylase [Moorena sp. SIO1G6]
MNLSQLTIPVTIILVPQGAEYQAICRGINQITGRPLPRILSIPIGAEPVTQYLETWLQTTTNFPKHSQPQVLLMGLCGSLSPNYSVGDIVVYNDCVAIDRNQDRPEPLVQQCCSQLTSLVQQQLGKKANLVRGLSSDRIIWSSLEKRQLGQSYQADVVDMEGFATLSVLNAKGFAVAMVRVISDDSYYNIPDLTSAISADGSLKPLPLAMGMLKQPIAATRLIRGSLRGLKVLEELSIRLFSNRQASTTEV